MEMEDLYL